MQTNFDEYYKEALIIKPDGKKIETKAWVQSKLILLQDISVPIQIGGLFGANTYKWHNRQICNYGCRCL